MEDTVVPDTGIGIGSVMDEVLLRGWESSADQQADKVVGSTPMGARYPIVNTPTREIESLPGSVEC